MFLTGLAVALTGCTQHPRDAVLSLDSDTRRYRSQDCRDARNASLNYRDNALARSAIGVAGNLLVPVLGSAASLAMGVERDRERQRLNRRVAETCMSDPFNERPPPRRRARGRR